MAVIDSGSSTAGKANVDANFNVAVVTPQASDDTGYIRLAGTADDGSITGTPDTRPVYATDDGRLATGETVILLTDTFNATAQNSANWRAPATTQTVTYAGGFVILNGGSVTTLNTNSAYQSYRTYPIFGFSELHVDCALMYTIAAQANETREAGLLAASLPGAAAPTDGVFFRWTTSGTLLGVVSYAGSETTTSSLAVPSANVVHTYTIKMRDDDVDFFVDDVLQASIVQSAFPARGQATSSSSLPFTVRYIIGASIPALASQTKIADVNIVCLEPAQGKPWATQMSAMGQFAYQGQNGGTMGSTALYTNSLAAGAGAAATNTTAALGSGLGGQFAVQPTLAQGTDGIISSFQNPAGTTAITARTLVVTGVRIQGLVTTAFTGGPVLYAYSLAFGHTAVSLATGEAATTKASRRIALGYETYVVTAAVGAVGQGVTATFLSPIVVNPGEFIQVVAKNLGTVTSAGVITLLITFDAYFE